MSLNITLLQESFDKAKPIADQVADKFYEILFSDYPQAEGLFENANMAKQKKALIRSLAFIVDNLENNDRLIAYIQGLGQRHGRYHVEEEHFDWVGASLLKTFAHFFEDGWTDELQTAWADAYGVIAQVMKEAMASTSASSRRCLEELTTCLG